MPKTYTEAPSYFNSKKVSNLARQAHKTPSSQFEEAPLPVEATSIEGVGYNEVERRLARRLRTEQC